MYAFGADMVFPYFQNFSQEFQQLEEFLYSQKSSNASLLDNLVQSSIISEYDFGGVSDLFRAPESIMEEPTLGVELDPISAAISMISCGSEDVITTQGLKVSDLETMQNERLLDVFYDCEKDLLAQTGVVDMSISDSSLLDIKTPLARTEEAKTEGNDEKTVCEGAMLQKSISSGCLGSMEWVNGASMKPNFMDFPSIDFGSVYGMRRAFSEGDIKTLNHGNVNPVPCPLERPVPIGNQPIEERREKLNRYKNKKTKRNFGRKIKYACRKALADSQPRIRGRFARTVSRFEGGMPARISETQRCT